MLTIDGLATGLDTSSIIEGLLAIQQSQIDRLSVRQQGVVTEQSAFKGIESRLLAFRSQVSRLTSVRDDLFRVKTATSSDESLVVAAASEDAASGAYNFRVNSVARAHQVATQGLAQAEAAITEGTLTLRVGSKPESTITIDSTNNTLSGLASAINSSASGITASVVNDGSTGGSPYRLLLSSNETGTENEISITNNLGASTSEATQPVFDLGNPVQAAVDTTLSFGSGAGAINIVRSSTSIDDVIPGVTLDVQAADSGKDIAIVISEDVETVQAAITDFVDSFNDAMEFIDDQSRYDADSDIASPLLGNRAVISIQDELRQALTEVVAGVDTDMNRLSALGITFSSTGRLVTNSSKLEDALSGRIEGVSLEDVRRMFVLDGQSTNGGVKFVLGTNDTLDSTTPYQVDITQAAERAVITATSTLAASTVIDNTNNTFSITIDGTVSSTLTLADGTYTRQELASLVETVINSDDELSGRAVFVGLDSDRLKITSDAFGSASQVTIGSGSALGDLGFAGTESDLGQNVAGQFLVNGEVETATGSGRLLSAGTENENTAGLQVLISLTSSQVQAGSDADLTITRGMAGRLDKLLDGLFDITNGRIKTTNDGFDQQVEDIEASIARTNEIFQERQEALQAEFIALETAVSQLQSTSGFLTAQLAAFAQLVPRSNN